MPLHARHVGIALGVILALAAAGPAWEWEAPVRVQAEPFWDRAPGTPALGMGGAFTALADDASAAAWNPAGLAALTPTGLRLMGSDLPALGATAGYPFLGVAGSVEGVAGGAWWAQRRLSEAETRSALGGAAALDFKGIVRLGVGVKRLIQTTATAEGQGVDLDLGVLAYFPGGLIAGFVLQDALGARLVTSGGATLTQVTSIIRLGVAWRPTDPPLTLAAEAALDEAGLRALRWGGAFRFMELFVLRLGFDGRRWSLGLGAGRERLHVDLAFRLGGAEGEETSWHFSTEIALSLCLTCLGPGPITA